MKRHSRALTTAVAVTALLLGGAGQSFAGERWGGDHHRQMNVGEHLQRLAGKLDLTPEQKAEMERIAKDGRPQLQELRQQLRSERQALMDQVREGYDEAKVRQRADAIGDRVAELTVAGARMGAEMRAVLTPEQQAKLDQLRQERRDKRGSRAQ